MRRQSSWLVVAVLGMMLIVFGAATAHAQQLENQAEVDQAMKDLADAEKQAKENIPNISTVKNVEDALDAAIRKNEDTQNNPAADKKAKDEAQKAQDDAQARADDLGQRLADRSAVQADRASKYRDALRKRREARKKLKELHAAMRRAAVNARGAGSSGFERFFNSWAGRLNSELQRSEKIIVPDEQRQTSAVPQRAATSPARLQPQGSTARDERSLGERHRDRQALGTALAELYGSANVTQRSVSKPVSRAFDVQQNNNLIRSVSNARQDDSGEGGEIGVRVPYVAGSYIDISYAFTAVKGSSSGAAGPIMNLFFPGTGVPGTANNSNPGGYFAPLNASHGFHYNYDMRAHAIYARYVGPNLVRDESDLLQWYVDMRASQKSLDDNFLFNVSGGVSANYVTQTDVKTVGLHAGFDYRYPLPHAPSLFIFLNAAFGLNAHWATSDVLFRFATPAFVDEQKVTIKDDSLAPSFSLQTGVGARNGFMEALLIFFAQVDSYGVPLVEFRADGTPPTLGRARETNVGGKVRISIPFEPVRL